MSRSPLTVPEHAELPSEVRQAYVDIDRKFGVFILPQLQQLSAREAVDRLLSRGAELAAQAAEGSHTELLAGYLGLLEEAQRELREARTQEVEKGGQLREQHQHTARLDTALVAAKGRLPASRMSRLEAQLAELAEAGGELEQRLALIEAAVLEWERLSQTRQAREADRLADQAHLPIRPRQLDTSRSRKARRDQARIVELARAFANENLSGRAVVEPGANREAAVTSDQ
ncbi:MAG TPA: hypothetical protein VMV23_06745 [Candidatus Nanopelagicaceae bacterium]|nr:hypothetical protein [Candidatus Nanopelagicaceae bacterium]